MKKIIVFIFLLLTSCATERQIITAAAGAVPVIGAVYNALHNPVLIQYRVLPGQCLWIIAKECYNDPFLWPALYKETTGISDPNKIEIGQVLNVKTNLTEFEKRIYRRQAFFTKPYGVKKHE